VHTLPRSKKRIPTRSKDVGNIDPFECGIQNNLDNISVPTVETASAMKNSKGSNCFASREEGPAIADSGRSEMPLKLYSTMVMSDDSASYGDNRSELEWNAGEDDGICEARSRTYMNIGNNNNVN